MSDWGINQTREAAWKTHREQCYGSWRTDKLARGMAYLAAAVGHLDRLARLEKVEQKYGRQFAEDLRAMYFRGVQ